MQLTESRVFELIGRLHAENRELSAENEALQVRVVELDAAVRRISNENARLKDETRAT